MKYKTFSNLLTATGDVEARWRPRLRPPQRPEPRWQLSRDMLDLETHIAVDLALMQGLS